MGMMACIVSCGGGEVGIEASVKKKRRCEVGCRIGTRSSGSEEEWEVCARQT